MKVLPWVHRSKKHKDGFAPLKLRITVRHRDSCEISTGRRVKPDLWNVESKRMSGKTAQSDIINRYIASSENKINKIYSNLELNDLPISAEIIRNIFEGNHVQRYGLLQVLDIHNDLFRQKLGQKGFSEARLKKYFTLKRKIEYFLQLKYKRKEIYMSELTLDFIESFWHFLTTSGKEIKGRFAEPLDAETGCGIIKQLKKVAKLGFRKQEIHINPFDDFKATFHKESKLPLTLEEVNRIMHWDFGNKTLNKVRDRAIVGFFTGLANQDIQTATRDMISINVDGSKWIDRGRTKTGELCIIPLWDPVIKIIEKYKYDPLMKGTDRLFPQISLQKMNEYLHEIAELCGIKKKLTTHVCRHTFADIYLNSGGSLDNLARILGHSTTVTTSVYAKRNKMTIALEANMVENYIFKNIRHG